MAARPYIAATAFAAGLLLFSHVTDASLDIERKTRKTVTVPVYWGIRRARTLQIEIAEPMLEEYTTTQAYAERDQRLHDELGSIKSNPDFPDIEKTYNDRMEMHRKRYTLIKIESVLGLGLILSDILAAAAYLSRTDRL